MELRQRSAACCKRRDPGVEQERRRHLDSDRGQHLRGGTTISGGTLQLGAGAATGSITGNILDNAILQFNRTDAGLSLAGNITGTGSVVQAGTGTSILAGNNSYSGVTTVSLGTLQAGSATGLSGTSDFTVNATGTLDLHGFSSAIGSLAGSGTVSDLSTTAVTLTAGDSVNTTFSGLLQNGNGSLGLVKSGTDTLILTGNNLYTGGTTISGGTLQLGNATATGSITGNILDNGILSLDRSDTALNLTGAISGTGSVVQAGTGSAVTLSGTNSYSGVTSVNTGTLQAGSVTAFSAASNFTVTGATLNLNGFSNSVGSLAGNGTVTTSVAGPVTLTAGANNASSVFSGTLQNGNGTLALTKVGTGIFTLSGTNTYSGPTTVSSGTLQSGSGSALSATSDFTVNSILDLNGFSNSIGSLAGSGIITNNGAAASTLNAGGDNASTTFSGALQNGTGILALTKKGTGTLILSGTSTYGGLTDVQVGQLSVRGTLANSAVQVESGAMLGGTGTISQAVTVLSGGILSPGNTGAGTLTVGSLVLNSGSFSDFDLGPAGVVGGGLNDLVIVNGNLTLGGTLNITDLGNFGPGVYRLFTDGTLTNNTMTIGTVPAGVTRAALSIQTSVANQVNLVVNGSSLLEFWDGPNTVETGTVTGGNGTWDNTTTNWTVVRREQQLSLETGLCGLRRHRRNGDPGGERDDRGLGVYDQWLRDHDRKRFNDHGRRGHDFAGP